MQNEPQIFVGPAGWSYPDWEGVVYPRGATATRLAAVAGMFDCVEVNSSFYRPPTSAMAGHWLTAVEHHRDFRFLAKAWQRFTHERTSRWTAAEFEMVAGGLMPLREAGRLDALLFQFPWSFRNNPVNRDWLSALREQFDGWPVAVELRHDSWGAEPVREFLAERAIGFCNIDQPALRHCLGATAWATTDIGYFRLHGRNAANWFKEKEEVYGSRYDYLYNEGELAQIVQRVRPVARQARRTFVVLNNHKDGKAVANALQLKAQLQPEVTPRAPATLVERFPGLRGVVSVTGQRELPWN